MPKILIIEDQPLIVELIEMVLKPRGYEVFHTGDGRKALDLIHEIRPDLILLDVMLPGMDGYSIQSKLLEDEDSKHIPIVIVTSKTQVEEVFQTSANVFGFVAKPFSVSDLIQKIEAALKSSPA